jgi:uroporphyrinogen-III synthase
VAEARPSPLRGKRIVITRAAEQSKSLCKVLQERGATPVLLPVVSFVPPEDFAPLDAALRHLRQFDWLFLTSQNALRAITERCRFLQVSLAEASRSLRIAAVGPATAEAAGKVGLRVAHVAAKHLGVALAEELAQEVKGRTVLLPRSDRGNPDLVEALQKLGARVTQVVAYRTVRPSEAENGRLDALARGEADAILFFSPSAAHHLQELLGTRQFVKLSQTAVFTAIGPVTAAALHEVGIARVLLAGDTAVAAVLDSLAEFFAGASQERPIGVKRG